jgi:hypothetical protein
MKNAPLLTGLACLVVVSHGALGQTSVLAESHFAKRMPPAELKRVYLACDSSATSGRLDFSDAIQCSFVAEELKQRVFEGDFDKLLAWWRVHRYRAVEHVAEE